MLRSSGVIVKAEATETRDAMQSTPVGCATAGKPGDANGARERRKEKGKENVKGSSQSIRHRRSSEEREDRQRPDRAIVGKAQFQSIR